ncbi:MAG: DUF6479 family protein [Actinomycetia bacterium]|nr:DUF6479 family protein [Actinomycetes bacterium]MCL2731956.1 DUF6479 family protein [Actinomycetes bacterium]
MTGYDHHAVQLAVTNDYLVGIGPLVLGICIVGLLIAAVWFGRRRSAGEPPVPRGTRARSGAWQAPNEQPPREGEVSDHGPGHQEEGPRSHESRRPVPNEVPRDGRRRFPHEINYSGVSEGRTRTTRRRHSGPNWD